MQNTSDIFLSQFSVPHNNLIIKRRPAKSSEMREKMDGEIGAKPRLSEKIIFTKVMPNFTKALDIEPN